MWIGINSLRFFIGVACSLLIMDFAHADILSVDNRQIHYQIWDETQISHPKHVVLLSGPIDSWHSDSAWWASLGPKLSKTHRVIAIDRAGLVLATPDAKVGYAQFAKDLPHIFKALNIQNATLLAFASSNISVQLYLDKHTKDGIIRRVLLIDPDVLTPFSIDRYKKDTKPFSENLDKYMEYINAGKYTARVEQKNTADMALLKKLSGDGRVDWHYIEKIFSARLKINNQLNLFREIAQYGKDLDLAAQTTWPHHIPLTIVDTDFELGYVENANDEEAKAGLLQWQKNAKEHYQSMTNNVEQGQYIHTKSRAHLYQFANVTQLVDMVSGEAK